MNAKCRRVENLGLVVIDYLQLMQSAGGQPRYSGENRQQVVSDISRALKIMAKELRVPVLCLSQLSRGPESRGDKRLCVRLRESGAIEQDADTSCSSTVRLFNEDSENHPVASAHRQKPPRRTRRWTSVVPNSPSRRWTRGGIQKRNLLM